MTEFQAIFEHALTSNYVEGSDMDTNVETNAHWHRICVGGLGAVSAGCTAWVQLTAAALVLNTRDLGMSTTEKALMRRCMLTQLFTVERSCNGLIRMSPSTFATLCEKLQGTCNLRAYAHTGADEQVATFLFIVGQKFSNRAISFFMSRSGETMSRYFHNVLNALISLAPELVKQPAANEVSNLILHSRRFSPYFKDCLGALDGTHIRVKVPRLDAARYRGRKDYPTQNVLASCSFDLRFTYVLAGWEGSASDSRILKSALNREDPLRIPNGRYYLGDAGFGLSSKILVPYGRTRYHLKEYAVMGPQNAKELFNLRHASLRNCIERCFGILKKRFPILSTGAESQYSCDTMTKIILATTVLHNFLISTEADEQGQPLRETHPVSVDVGTLGDDVGSNDDNGTEYTKGKELRDYIVSEMWKDYELEYPVGQFDVSM